MEIKLPKTTLDLRLEHYEVLANPLYSQKMDLNLVVDFLHDFTGIAKGKIKQIEYNDCMMIYNHVVKLYEGYNPQDPPQEITVKGVDYELINPDKVSTGWHIDFGNTDVEREHIRLACLMYYPKGSIYGETDENDNLIYPIESRYYDFKEEFPLATYLDASAFFLRRSKASMSVFMVKLKLQRLKRKILQALRLTNGKKQYML